MGQSPWLQAVCTEACFLERKLQGSMGRFEDKWTRHACRGPGLKAAGAPLGSISLVSTFVSVGHFTLNRVTVVL